MAKQSMRALAIVFATTLIASYQTSIVSAATPKKGLVCSKIGQTFGKGSKKLTCAPVTKLRWLSTPVKPPAGSIFAPANVNQSIRIGNADFAVKEIDFGIGVEICQQNPFNEGCVLGPKLQGLVDVNSDVRWIAINVEIENGYQNTFAPSFNDYVFYLVQENNELIENNVAAVISKSLFDLSIETGESGSGQVVFSVPKSIGSLNPLLVIRDQSTKTTKDYYCLLDW